MRGEGSKAVWNFKKKIICFGSPSLPLVQMNCCRLFLRSNTRFNCSALSVTADLIDKTLVLKMYQFRKKTCHIDVHVGVDSDTTIFYIDATWCWYSFVNSFPENQRNSLRAKEGARQDQRGPEISRERESQRINQWEPQRETRINVLVRYKSQRK